MFNKISVLLFAVLIIISFNNNSVAAHDINGPEVIHKEVSQIFTTSDLLKLFDHDVFIQEDGYTGHGNVPGEYTVKLSQGSKTKDVQIIVVNAWSNLPKSSDVLFVTDYKNIYVSNNRQLTLYEIIFFIYKTTGYVNTNYDFLYNEIINQYHTSFTNGTISKGSYILSFKLTYFSGEQASYSALIHAVELPELTGTILAPPPSAIDKLIKSAPIILIVAFGIYLITNSRKKRGYNL